MLNNNWLIKKLDTIDSTQNYAKSLKTYGKQIALLAKEQTSGYGQHGRKWIGVEGNLYLSLVIPADNITSDITLVTAIAIGDIILRHDIYIQYKWINDILINGEKVGGILTEYYNGNLIIGIGLNLKGNPEDIIDLKTTNLFKYGMDMPTETCLDYILSSFTINYNKWLQGGFKLFKNIWKAYAYKLYDDVTITYGNIIINGIFIDIDDNGHIIIENSSGLHRLQKGSLR
jgi:BirA family biotin operon repressor/biotin-[acetyl-CoA-carboxylase] ligase